MSQGARYHVTTHGDRARLLRHEALDSIAPARDVRCARHSGRRLILWVGVDVGGTFTDVVVYDEGTETLRVAKSPTDPVDPTRGLLQAFAKLDVALAATERLVHGTTIGTNAILERKGATVWVITTRGFADTLEIARTNRTVLYDIRAIKPPSLVPRQRVLEVDERMAYDGSVLRPLEPAAVVE